MRAVLGRDFVAEGCRDRAFALRTLAGGAAALLLGTRALTTLGGVALDEAGAEAFRGITAALFLLLAAATPALLAPSLLEERRAGTLDLLLASPIGVTGLVAGKLLSRLGTVLTWAAAALPPLSLALLFGGTPWSRFFDVAAGLLGTAVEAGALGLLVSCGARRTATAALLAYLLPALHWSIVPALRQAGLAGTGSTWEAVLAGTTPLPFLEGALPGAGLRFLLFALLLAAAALPAAGFLLLREAPARRAPRRRRMRLPFEDRVRALLFRDNPVAWKESLFLDTAWSRLLFLLLAGVLLAGEAAFTVLQARGRWDAETNQAWLLACFSALAGVAAVQGASTASAEKNGPTFDILRATPLTSGEIARGKLAGLSAGLCLLMAVPLSHVALSVPADYLTGSAAAVTAVAGLFLVGNAAVHGLAWGFATRTGTGAVAGAASFIAFSHGSCGLLCPAASGALVVKAARKSAPSFEYLGLVVMPAVLCGFPWFLLYTAPLSVDAMGRGGDGGLRGGPGTFNLIGLVVFLGMTALFALYDARRMPALLEREMFRLSRGETDHWDGPERMRAQMILWEAQAVAIAKRAKAEDAARGKTPGGLP